MEPKKDQIANLQILQKQIDSIFEYFIAPDIRYSPILNPDKLHLYHAKSKVAQNPQSYLKQILSEILFFIPRIMWELSMAILKHFYYIKNYAVFKENSFQEIDSFFVSHYTHGRNPQDDFDTFFGSLPFRKESGKNLILLIDHMARKKSIKNYEILSQSSKQYLLLPKTCSNKLFFRILFVQIKNVFYVIYNLFSVLSTINIDIKFYLEIARNQISRAAINNHVLLYNLSFALEKSNATQITITYEGHAYESFVIHKIKTRFKDIKIQIIQHAPVVKSQNTFFRNLSFLPPDTKIFVTGKSIKKMILDSGFQVKSKIEILGSFKHANKPSTLKNKKKHLHVLIAIENDHKTSKDLTALAKKLSKAIPDIKFTLRPHPDFILKRGNKDFSNLDNYPNLKLSSSSLERDLLASDICFYNSSSISIECLRYHVEPIHYSCYTNLDLDPIQLIDLPHKRFSDSQKAMDYLIYRSNNKSIPSSYRLKMDEAYDMYYAIPNFINYFLNSKEEPTIF